MRVRVREPAFDALIVALAGDGGHLNDRLAVAIA